MPPQVNARLVTVTGATAATGGRDDWDAALAGTTGPAAEPAGAGPVKWTQDGHGLNAYLRERVQRIPAGGTVTVVAVRTLYVDAALARAAQIDTDDVLTFIGPSGVEETARAAMVAVSELAGIPPALQTARLELEA